MVNLSDPASSAASIAPAAGRGGWRASLGLAVILVGQPIAWTVRGAVGGGISPVYPIVAIVVGFALLARVDWFRRPQVFAPTLPLAALILLWLIPLAALSLLAPVEVGTDGAYAVFVAAVVFGLALTPIAALDRLPEAMTIIGGISSVLPLGNLAFGHAVEKFARLTVAGTDNQAIAGSVGGATMIAALMVVRRSTRPGIAVGAACGAAFNVGLAAVVLSNTRSVMIFLAVCLPLTWWYFAPRLVPADMVGSHGGQQRRTFALLVVAALIGAPAAAAAVFKAKARDAILKQFTERLGSALGFLEPTHFRSIDTSSRIRVHILDYTVRRLDLVGHGISEQIRSGFGFYPHLTYLQALYDFGVLGGLLYLVLALVLPGMMIVDHLRGGRLNPASAFVIVYFLYGLADQFSHTTPYAWPGLLQIGLVYTLVGRAGPPLARSSRTSAKHAMTAVRV